jgi:hypothetical protein
MKKIITSATILLMGLAASCQTDSIVKSDHDQFINYFNQLTSDHVESLQTVQDFKLLEGKWKPVGNTYQRPDTLTTIHHYTWKGKKITAVQDLKKNKYGSWFEYGDSYPLPDSVKIIHALVKN